MPLTTRTAALATTAALALLVLTACDPTGGVTPTASGTRSATPSPTATSTPSPTASPDAGGGTGGGGGGAAALTCDSILSPAVRAEFNGGGLMLTPPADFFAKIRGEIPAGYVSPWLFFQDNDGIVCTWHNGSEVIWVYGYMDLPAAQYPAFRDAIMNSGDPYLMEESDAVLFTSQSEANPFTYVLVGDGPAYVATTIGLLDDMRAIVP